MSGIDGVARGVGADEAGPGDENIHGETSIVIVQCLPGFLP